MRRSAPLAFFACLATLAAAAGARAQDGGTCTPTTVIAPEESFPASSGGNVATDIAVRVRYTPGAASMITDPPSTLVSLTVDATGASVPGTASWLGDTLVFRPSSPLAALTRYDGVAIGPDATLEFSFNTGVGPDTGAPTFSHGEAITSIMSSATSPTCEVPDGAYRIDVTVNQAVDDGAPGDIEYLLYVWRAANLHAPRRVARIRNFASSSGTIPMSFVLPTDQSTARVCVAVLAIDDVGHIASSDQKCVDPIQGNFFEGCAVSSPRPSSPLPFAPLAVLAAVVVAARRRRR